MVIRPARKKDHAAILAILEETDLFYAGIPLMNFYAAEEGGKVLGIVQFKEYKDYYFISSLGVGAKEQGKGIATKLINYLLGKTRPGKKICLYTVIPAFFEKFGFKLSSCAKNLPPKELYQCKDCFPKKCKCMVKDNR